MPSTWAPLYYWQEEPTTAPEWLSTTRLAGWETSLDYSRGDIGMGAATSTTTRAVRWDIDINYSPLIWAHYIIFQTLLVTGGYDSSGNLVDDFLSSTELLVGTASAWVNTGELPSPRRHLRGTNIDSKVLMTGNWYQSGNIYLLINI